MRELLIEHGFRETNKLNEYIKPRYNVQVGENSITIFYYTKGFQLRWTETYYNFENFKKYIKKEHKFFGSHK